MQSVKPDDEWDLRPCVWTHHSKFKELQIFVSPPLVTYVECLGNPLKILAREKYTLRCGRIMELSLEYKSYLT